MLTLMLADITELNLPKTCCLSFPNGKDGLMSFEATIKPGEGDTASNLENPYRFTLVFKIYCTLFFPLAKIFWNSCFLMLRKLSCYLIIGVANISSFASLSSRWAKGQMYDKGTCAMFRSTVNLSPFMLSAGLPS